MQINNNGQEIGSTFLGLFRSGNQRIMETVWSRLSTTTSYERKA